jgi:hypothetical protein
MSDDVDDAIRRAAGRGRGRSAPAPSGGSAVDAAIRRAAGYGPTGPVTAPDPAAPKPRATGDGGGGVRGADPPAGKQDGWLREAWMLKKWGPT